MVYAASVDSFILFGGSDGRPQSDTWAFNEARSSWIKLQPVISPAARINASMAYDSSTDKVLLFGGSGADGVLSDTWLFNPQNSTWTELKAPLSPDPRKGASMAYDASSGLFVLFGGEGQSGFLGDTWVFNPTNSTWTQLNPALSPAARGFASMDFDSSTSTLVLFGGSNSSNLYGDTWLFDLVTSTWTALSPTSAPTARASATMVYDASESRFLLFGGQGNGGSLLQDSWTFDSASSLWTRLTLTRSPTARSSAVMAYDSSRGTIVLFGGRNLSGILGDTWLYAHASQKWVELSPSPAPTARAAPSMVYDSSVNLFVLFGGQEGSLYFKESWLLDPISSGWKFLSPPISPSPRADGSMVFDSSAQASILFGGQITGGYYHDSWAFDAGSATWVILSPSDSPSGRSDASMAFNSSNGTSLLFGGQGSSGFLGDSWLFSLATSSWSALNPATSPTSRSGASMAFNSSNGTFLLFGGVNSGGPLGDTWLYDPALGNWRELSPPTPPAARAFASMVFDSANKVFLLFGGGHGGSRFNDSWLFDPASGSWMELHPTNPPPGRSFAPMAYNSTSGAALIFGGDSGHDLLGDAWQLRVSPPPLPHEKDSFGWAIITGL